MKRVGAVASLVLLGATSLARAGDAGVELHYPGGAWRSDVSIETSMAVAIAGTEPLAGYVRSLHPFLSLSRFHVRARGRLLATPGDAGALIAIESDEARAEACYDDEDLAWDLERAVPPGDLATNKLEQMIWSLSMGRRFTISGKGVYRSEAADQDHNGEAIDLIALAVTRLPGKPVKRGDSWQTEWKGERNEKDKTARFAFRQRVEVAGLEERSGKTVATLASTLEGELAIPASERQPQATEQWTRCDGHGRLVLEVATGKILALEGAGKVVAYYSAAAEDGSKTDVKVTWSVESSLKQR